MLLVSSSLVTYQGFVSTFQAKVLLTLAMHKLVWCTIVRIIADQKVLAEIAALQKSIYHMKGDAFCADLETNLFPSLGISPAAGQAYIQALQHMDLKQFKKYFMVLYSA
jgi:hypothetical protein